MAGEAPHLESLKGKRVLITGGSAGIGRATALQFDANGAIVTVMGRRLERLEAVVKQMKHGHAVVGDLSEAGDMARVVQEAIEKMGGLDVLVNNGGASNDAMVGETEEAYLAAMKLHVTGNMALIRAAEEELIKNKGAIVNVSSIAAIVPILSFPQYCAAKAGMDALTKNLALKLARQGVRVNSVLPGAIDTEVFDRFATQANKSREQVLEETGKLHAMGRAASADEVAAPIVFLASDAASFITGVNLCVDGGATLGYWMNRGPLM